MSPDKTHGTPRDNAGIRKIYMEFSKGADSIVKNMDEKLDAISAKMVDDIHAIGRPTVRVVGGAYIIG